MVEKLDSIDSEQINQMVQSINNITKQMGCDKACKKKKKLKSLENKLKEAEFNEIHSERLLIEAEENYLREKLGLKYDAHKAEKELKMLEKQKQEAKGIFLNNLDLLNKTSNDYEQSGAVYKQLIELLAIEKTKSKKMTEEIETIKNSSTTNQRKYYYEVQQQDWIDGVRHIILYIYYGIFVVYILLSDFIWKDGYKDMTTWLILVVYIIFPYFLNRITDFIFWSIYKIHYVFSNNLPKDVYYDL